MIFGGPLFSLTKRERLERGGETLKSLVTVLGQAPCKQTLGWGFVCTRFIREVLPRGTRKNGKSGSEKRKELVMSNWKPQSQATPTGRFKEKNLWWNGLSLLSNPVSFLFLPEEIFVVNLIGSFLSTSKMFITYVCARKQCNVLFLKICNNINKLYWFYTSF